MNDNQTKVPSNFHSKKSPIIVVQRVDKSGVDSWINAAQTIFLLIFCLKMAILTILWYLGFYQPFKKDGYRKWDINKLQSSEIRERILFQEFCSWPYPYPSYLCYSNPSLLMLFNNVVNWYIQTMMVAYSIKLSTLIERERMTRKSGKVKLLITLKCHLQSRDLSHESTSFIAWMKNNWCNKLVVVRIRNRAY